MNKYIEKIFMTSAVLLVVTFVFVMISVLISIFYKEIVKPEPPVECRNGKLYKVSHEGNITIYDPTFDECEVAK